MNATGVYKSETAEGVLSAEERNTAAIVELQQSVYEALETYSNVHRGSGHNSLVTTYLYEQAREIVLAHLGWDEEKHTVIFCSPRRAEMLERLLKPKSYRSLSSQDIGLPLGVRALVIEKKAVPHGVPFQTGGGTARLVGPNWVVWSRSPDKFEAGTPAILNVIAFARALQLTRRFGKDAFRSADIAEITAKDILYCDELDQYSGRELLNELRKSLIGQRTPVPTTEGIRPFINLDNGASTPTFVPIWDAVWQTWQQTAEVHQEIVQEVKAICSRVLAAPLDEYNVIFTSNTTEAINLAAQNLELDAERDIEPVVVTTMLEHNSNELPWRKVSGASLLRLQIDSEGFLDLVELERILSSYNEQKESGRKRIKLVAISGASNVLGVFNDLAGISQIVHRYGAHLLVDGAQLVAHRKVDIQTTGIDYFAFSGHKAYAPFGTGVLIVRKALLKLSPDEINLIQASGEENAGGIAALGKALLLLQRIGLDVIQKEEQALTARILQGLAQVPGLTMYGVQRPDSPSFVHKGGVVVFTLQDRLATEVGKSLAEQGGIGIRGGCHCAHLTVKRLLNIPPWQVRLQRTIVSLFPQLSLPGVARVSLGIENTDEDVEMLICVLSKIARDAKPGLGNPFSATKTEIQQQMDDFAQNIARQVYS
jgi:selenocysteine lyase/cysteine desulfurase